MPAKKATLKPFPCRQATRHGIWVMARGGHKEKSRIHRQSSGMDSVVNPAKLRSISLEDRPVLVFDTPTY